MLTNRVHDHEGNCREQFRWLVVVLTAKGIFSAVTILAWTDKNLCRRHQLWTGHGVTSIEDQADIASIPEIGQAQARISRLARHRGPRGIWHSYRTPEDIIDWYSRESSSRTARQERLRHFLASSSTGRLPRSYDHASYYPEVAGALSVITSPYWQRMAGSGDADDAARLYRRFAADQLADDILLQEWAANAP